MIGSANEVMTLAAKAARGAGAPVALAAEFGRAALHHLTTGRAAQDLADALDTLPEGPIVTLPLLLMAHVETGNHHAELPASPLPDLCLSYAEAQGFQTTAHLLKDKVILEMAFDIPRPPHPVSRVTLPDTLATKMQRLAARLLVPETDASRRAGAGAGLSDND
ncbi:MAG: hypothetical protein ACJAVM_002553 [Sulfitobacter sp.]|jgi:hypothetical protein